MTQASVKLIAFDLDGTLSQHRSTPPPESFALLDELSKDCRLLMVGAGYATGKMVEAEAYVITIIVIEVVLLAIATGIVLGVYRDNGEIYTRSIKNLRG